MHKCPPYYTSSCCLIECIKHTNLGLFTKHVKKNLAWLEFYNSVCEKALSPCLNIDRSGILKLQPCNRIVTFCLRHHV